MPRAGKWGASCGQALSVQAIVDITLGPEERDVRDGDTLVGLRHAPSNISARARLPTNRPTPSRHAFCASGIGFGIDPFGCEHRATIGKTRLQIPSGRLGTWLLRHVCAKRILHTSRTARPARLRRRRQGPTPTPH